MSGTARECTHCKTRTCLKLCGGCMGVAYCGTKCQRLHREVHAPVCFVGGKDRGDKRGRSDEEEEGVQEKNTVTLTHDAMSYLFNFLHGKDFKNLRITEKKAFRASRGRVLRDFNWYVPPDELNMFFKRMIGFIDQIELVIDDEQYMWFNNEKRMELYRQLKRIELFWDFNLQIELPPALTHLYMSSHNFNHPIKLPETLKYFEMSNNFNRKIDLPKNLTHFYMGSSFNQPIDLPSTLTRFTMGSNFNRHIDLPSALTEFTMGSSFNQAIDLPSALTHFTMGSSFNQAIDLPSALTRFTMGSKFNQPIQFPISLVKFEMGSAFDRVADLSMTNISEIVLPNRSSKFIRFPPKDVLVIIN